MLKRTSILYLITILFAFSAFRTDLFASEEPHLQTTEMLEAELHINFNSESEKIIDKVISFDELSHQVFKNYNNYDKKSSILTLNISMPKEFTISKSEARSYGERYFNDKIKKISNLFDVNVDIDDIEFQTIVKAYALEDNNFIEFARFIDIYENYEYNNEMKDLINSIELLEYESSDKLFDDDRFNALISMMPVDTEKYPSTVKSDAIVDTYSNRQLSEYDGKKAKEYAKKWAKKTNNKDYGYYANYYNHPTPSNNDMWSGGKGDNKRNWNDCTNFVSQCLAAGGAVQIKEGWWNPHKDKGNWYYSGSKPSHTWGGANNFFHHWSDRVGVRSKAGDTKVGDPVSLDFDGDKVVDHTVIITSVNGRSISKMLYACHTSDQFEETGKSLSTLFNTYKRVWVYPLS